MHRSQHGIQAVVAVAVRGMVERFRSSGPSITPDTALVDVAFLSGDAACLARLVAPEAVIRPDLLMRCVLAVRDDVVVANEISQPSGTVTFLFTDIEGSTRLWEDNPVDMSDALERHDDILRRAIAGHAGYVFSIAGDAFGAAFARADDAVGAALALQVALSAGSWPAATPIRVRVGLNTGEARERDGNYFGPAVNRAARIMAAGHGGQILVSAATAAVIASDELVDLGEHRLKDLSAKERLLQVGEGSFPALRSLDTARHNLPVERTPLIGRRDDINEIADLVTRHRLVTLLGIGGTGKTRVATAVAAEVADGFEDGTWFVDLVPATGAEQVAEAIAAAAGLSVAGSDLVGALGELIADRDMLVVLDNCEHITDDVAEVLDLLLESAEGPRFLATSREPLQLLDERHVHVLPLEVDDNLAAPAVELFATSAERIGAHIEPDDVQLVSQICVELDGLPLAIELAAAQLRQYTMAELADRLDKRFELLATGRRGRRRRQASLQAVLENSWGMLDTHEQLLLMLLAAFPSSFTADDAEQLAIGVATAPAGRTLGQLIDRSLVATDGNGRHRLLETVKLFARNQWTEEDPDSYLEAHTRWVLDRFRSHTPQEWYTSASLAAWANDHYEDHRVVEERLVEQVRLDDLTALFAGLTGTAVWTTAWRASTAIDRVERYLDQLPIEPHQEAVFNLFAAGSGLSCRRHDWIARGSNRAVDLLPEPGRAEERAWALIISSWMTVFRDADLALELVDEAETIASEAGAQVITDIAGVYRANHLALSGRMADARDLLEILKIRIEKRPFDRSWLDYLGITASLYLTTQPDKTKDATTAMLKGVRGVYGRAKIPAPFQVYEAIAAGASGDIGMTRLKLALTEQALRDDSVEDGLPDLLIPMAALAWAIGDLDRARIWLTAVRHSPVPTHDFNATIDYRQLRDQVGLLDHSALGDTTVEDNYQDACNWLADLRPR